MNRFEYLFYLEGSRNKNTYKESILEISTLKYLKYSIFLLDL